MKRNNNAGFSLVEILVVLVIMGLLILIGVKDSPESAGFDPVKTKEAAVKEAVVKAAGDDEGHGAARAGGEASWVLLVGGARACPPLLLAAAEGLGKHSCSSHG